MQIIGCSLELSITHAPLGKAGQHGGAAQPWLCFWAASGELAYLGHCLKD